MSCRRERRQLRAVSACHPRLSPRPSSSRCSLCGAAVAWRARRVDTFQDYFSKMTTAVRIRIATHRVPDFAARYPSLLTKPIPLGGVAGWEIRCNWTGVPFSWTPLTALEVLGAQPDQPQFVEVNADLLKREHSKSIAVSRRGTWTAGKDLEIVLQQLFGLK